MPRAWTAVRRAAWSAIPGLLLAGVLSGQDASPVPAGRRFADAITVEAPHLPAAPGVVERKAADERARSPETTAADAAARLPGVVVEGELGEADRVLVRGAEARLVATTLDGERLPSPDGEARSAGLSLIPAYLLEEVAVSKTLSPDRDADAIGGTVDLVTRRAPVAGLTSVELRGGAQSSSGGPLYGGDLALGRRLLDGRLGLLAAVTAEGGERQVDGVSARYDGEETESAETREYALDRERLGGLITVDLAPSEGAALELRGLYNRERTLELRRRVQHEVEEGRIERELKDAELWRELLSVSVNGSRLSGATLVEASLGSNGAIEREPDRVDTSFVQEDVEFIASEPVNEDPDLFRLDKIGVEDNATRERNLFAAVDLTHRFLKAGAKWRDKGKRRDLGMTLFHPEGEIPLPAWPMIDPESARRLLASLGSAGRLGEAEEAADYRAGETAGAAYVQAEVRLGRLTLLPGVRYEQTWSDYRGFELVTGEEESELRPLRGERSYGVWLPMLSAGLVLRDDLQVRAAVTRGFSRPDYFDLVPYRVIDAEEQEIEEGNADLRPTRSWNVDGRLDWQPAPGSSVGVGVFYRELTDFTFLRRGTADIVEREDGTWESTRPENGARARLHGFEFLGSWRLRGGWDVEASSTWTQSAAWPADTEERAVRLPGQAPWSGRLGLSYDRHRWTGALAFTWARAYRTELGAGEEEDLFRDSQRHLDLFLSYTFASGLRWRFEARNLTDDPERFYVGDPGRPAREESYGRALLSGISFQF